MPGKEQEQRLETFNSSSELLLSSGLVPLLSKLATITDRDLEFITDPFSNIGRHLKLASAVLKNKHRRFNRVYSPLEPENANDEIYVGTNTIYQVPKPGEFIRISWYVDQKRIKLTSGEYEYLPEAGGPTGERRYSFDQDRLNKFSEKLDQLREGLAFHFDLQEAFKIFTCIG